MFKTQPAKKTHPAEIHWATERYQYIYIFWGGCLISST